MRWSRGPRSGAPRAIVRTRPLEARRIGDYIRGLSNRDIESFARKAGLGTISRTTIDGICAGLRDRCRGFRAGSLFPDGVSSARPASAAVAVLKNASRNAQRNESRWSRSLASPD